MGITFLRISVTSANASLQLQIDHKINIAAAAPNMATIVRPTTIRDSQELGCAFITLRSDAATKIATNKNGANTPLITAVQKSALTGLMFAKSIKMPTNVEPITIR